MATLLHRAVCRSNSIEIVRLIREGVDINEESADGCSLTALHVAAIVNFELGCEILLIAGAKPNKRAVNGMTPLHIASIFHSEDAFAVLERFRGDLYAKTHDGYSPDRIYNKSVSFRKKYWERFRMPVRFDTIISPECESSPKSRSTSTADSNNHLSVDLEQLRRDFYRLDLEITKSLRQTESLISTITSSQ